MTWGDTALIVVGRSRHSMKKGTKVLSRVYASATELNDALQRSELNSLGEAATQLGSTVTIGRESDLNQQGSGSEDNSIVNGKVSGVWWSWSKVNACHNSNSLEC